MLFYSTKPFFFFGQAIAAERGKLTCNRITAATAAAAEAAAAAAAAAAAEEEEEDEEASEAQRTRHRGRSWEVGLQVKTELKGGS